MCYSEELKREAGGFMVGEQWVLTGWKGMMVANASVREVEVPHVTNHYRWVLSPSSGFEWDKVASDPTYTYTKETRIVPHPGKIPIFHSMYLNDYVYEFGKVLTDEHGFHLAASLDGAMQALSFSANAVYTKILALESSIEDNHAHVVMVMEPGKDPTQEQIEAVAKQKCILKNKAKAQLYGTSSITAAPGSANWIVTSGYSSGTSYIVPQYQQFHSSQVMQLYGNATFGAAQAMPTTASGIWVGGDELES